MTPAPETTDLIEWFVEIANDEDLGPGTDEVRKAFHEAATALSEKDRRIVMLGKDRDGWKQTAAEYAQEVHDLRARLASCEAALEEMTPHVAAIERAIRINDEWGRVIVGQTEAAAEIARIHSAAVTKGDNHAAE